MKIAGTGFRACVFEDTKCDEAIGGIKSYTFRKVAIKSTGGDEVDDEMTGPEWEGFVADFENRTRDAVYITAQRIIG